MEERTLLASGPVTQSIQAVAELLGCLGRPTDPIPEVVDLLGVIKLVKSNKGDVFYCVTEKSCSCPNSCYRPGSVCKHRRKYFGQKAASKPLEEKPGWEGGQNGPMVEEAPKEVKKANSPCLIDAYAFETTAVEVQYWQRKQAKQGQEA